MNYSHNPCNHNTLRHPGLCRSVIDRFRAPKRDDYVGQGAGYVVWKNYRNFAMTRFCDNEQAMQPPPPTQCSPHNASRLHISTHATAHHANCAQDRLCCEFDIRAVKSRTGPFDANWGILGTLITNTSPLLVIITLEMNANPSLVACRLVDRLFGRSIVR